MNSIAVPMDESLNNHTDEIVALQKFTHSIWLYVSMLYPLNSLSWNVDVNPSKPRYPTINAMPYMPVDGPPSAADFDVVSPYIAKRVHPVITPQAIK